MPVVEPGEEEAWGALPAPLGRFFKRAKPGSSQRCVVGGQEVAGMNLSQSSLCLLRHFSP